MFEAKTIVTFGFIAYAVLLMSIHRLTATATRVKVVKLLLSFSLIISLGAYVYAHGYIESRGDAKHVISVADALAVGGNPYTATFPSSYGPLYNILIAPVALIPYGWKVVTYGISTLALLSIAVYGLSRKLDVGDPLLITLASIANPAIHYYAISLAQVDDLLLTMMLTILTLTLHNRFLTSLVIAMASLVKPTGLLAITTLLRRGELKYVISSMVVVVAANLVGIYLYGYPLIHNAYLAHAGRVDGLSIASIISYFINAPPILYTITSLALPIASVLVFRVDDRVITLIVTYLVFYTFAPLNYPEYRMWLMPVMTAYAMMSNDVRLLTPLSLMIISDRLWQEFVQSNPQQPNVALHAITTLALITAQLLMVKNITRSKLSNIS